MEGGVEGGLEIYRLGRDCCRWGSPWTVSGVCWVRARVLADVELGISDGEALMNEKELPGKYQAFSEYRSPQQNELTVQKPLTNPPHLPRRRPRPRHQHLNHALQRPSPFPQPSSSSSILLSAPKIQPHALVRLGQRPEGGRDVAGDGDGVVVGDGARVDVLEGGEEGGEVGAPGRVGAGGVGGGGFGDVVLDWRRLVGVFRLRWSGVE